MKKIALLIAFVLSFTVIFSQNKTQVQGIWQAKLEGKFMTGKDLGVTAAPYSSQSVFYIFSKESCYFALCSSKASLTKANIQNLIGKQVASEGTYAVYDSLPAIPEDFIEKFEEQSPFKPKTCFIEASIQGEPMSFYFEPGVKKIFGLSKEMKVELVYSGSSW
jgi:hypothetical protein